MSLTADTEKAVSHSTHGIADAQGVSKPAPKTHPSPDIKTDKKDDATKEDDKLSTELAAREAAIKKPFGEAWKDLRTSASHFLTNLRHHAIGGTPRFIVNNSSNVFGATHVATEVLMFKAGLKEGERLVQNPEKPINWIVQPVKRIAEDIVTKSKSRDYSFGQLFEGNVFKNINRYVRDTNDATSREVKRQIESGEFKKGIKLGNSWQTRTTFAGLAVWILSTVLPERKDSDEEVERMATMRTLHPVQYVGERLKQAVWVPDWTSHKRQMIGLGYLVIGVCSMLGSWRQRRDIDLKKDVELISQFAGQIDKELLPKVYTFNPAYFFTSVLSFIGSIPLLFALDESKAYSLFGSTMMLRIPLLFKSIGQKYHDNDPGKHSYTISSVSFQLENAGQALVGGATKLKDGTIVDHEEEKLRAIAEAKQIKQERKKLAHADYQSERPSTAINQVSDAQLAMPERREAVLEAASAANV